MKKCRVEITDYWNNNSFTGTHIRLHVSITGTISNHQQKVIPKAIKILTKIPHNCECLMDIYAKFWNVRMHIVGVTIFLVKMYAQIA